MGRRTTVKNGERTSIYVEAALLKRIDRIAKKKGLSRCATIRMLLLEATK